MQCAGSTGAAAKRYTVQECDARNGDQPYCSRAHHLLNAFLHQ